MEYYDHGAALDRMPRPYSWVYYRFVDGDNLRDLLKDKNFNLTITFIEAIVRTVLSVLHSCQMEGITHGDLHAGNILVAKPDRRILDSKETIYVSDFGFGGSHNAKKPKDDFQELANMILDLLVKLPFSELNPRDRRLHVLLKEFTTKRIRDGGRTVNLTASKISSEFSGLCLKAERESAAWVGANQLNIVTE